jgi:hypothetical protein
MYAATNPHAINITVKIAEINTNPPLNIQSIPINIDGIIFFITKIKIAPYITMHDENTTADIMKKPNATDKRIAWLFSFGIKCFSIASCQKTIK